MKKILSAFVLLFSFVAVCTAQIGVPVESVDSIELGYLNDSRYVEFSIRPERITAEGGEPSDSDWVEILDDTA